MAAGVTFYALLALFPTIAAIVSLYGLFADASTINEHLKLISGFLPEGALFLCELVAIDAGQHNIGKKQIYRLPSGEVSGRDMGSSSCGALSSAANT